MLNLVAVLVVLLVHLFGCVPYAEEEQSGCKYHYAQHADQKRNPLDESEHAEGGAQQEKPEGDKFVAVVFNY